ncbi:Uncharacterised protein [BD1-7 clade bacterium]|nr:Uncharacterised protein [BD1-7 clade bacterium]
MCHIKIHHKLNQTFTHARDTTTNGVNTEKDGQANLTGAMESRWEKGTTERNLVTLINADR